MDHDPQRRIRDHLERLGLAPNAANEWNGLWLHAVSPAAERNYFVLVTSGLSAIEMPLPAGASNLRARRIELCLLIAPADLDLEWPMRLLRELVEVVRQGERLALGHTVAEEPPEPYGDTQFVGAMLFSPAWLGSEFQLVAGEPEVELLQIVPITASELALARASDANAVRDLLVALEPHFLGPIDPARDCTVAPRELRTGLPQRPASTGGARIVVPFSVAETTSAIDLLIGRAARVTGNGPAYVRVTASPAFAAHLIQIHGRRVGALAAAMSLVERTTVAIHIHDDLGCAVAYADGAEVARVVGTADDARSFVTRHLELARAAEAEPYQVRWLRWGPGGLEPVDEANVVWSDDLDDAFELAVARALLAPVAADLIVRFGRWRRAYAVHRRARTPETRDAEEVARLDVIAFVRAALPEGAHRGDEAMRHLLLDHGVTTWLLDEFAAKG